MKPHHMEGVSSLFLMVGGNEGSGKLNKLPMTIFIMCQLGLEPISGGAG